jgi:epoxyqueuosine reductase
VSAVELTTRLAALGLEALGAAPPDPAFAPRGTRSVALIGPMGGTMWWDIVTASPEWADGRPDPLDRWSRRVLTALAADLGATAHFPFDGPPWLPFQSWAIASGRAWQSPVRLLVHATAGLWVSFRGALALPFVPDLPPLPNPCDSCTERPCLTACPAGALTGAGYDVPACHAYLDTAPGRTCLSQGCRVRAACPVSARHARLPAQSAHHMSRFHP